MCSRMAMTYGQVRVFESGSGRLWKLRVRSLFSRYFYKCHYGFLRKIAMKYKYVFFIMCLLLSCKQKVAHQPTIDTSELTVIEIDNSNFEIGHEYPVDMDTLISNLEFIPLETISQSFIGMCTKVFVEESRIVIFDKYNTNEILIFDRSGKYINKIRKGKGPGEHSQAIDCFINEMGHIEVYDMFTHKIREYSLDGGYLNDKQLPNLFQEHVVSVGDIYFIESPYKKKSSGLYNLFLFNHETGAITANLFPCSPKDTEKDLFTTDRPMDVYQKCVNYSMPYNDTVFSIDSDGNVQARYYIKYAKQALPPAFLSKYEGTDPSQTVIENNYVVTTRVQEAESYLVIDYLFNNNTPYTAIYDKRKGKVILNSSSNDGRLYEDFYFLLNLRKISSNVFATVYPHIDYPLSYFKDDKQITKQLRRFPVEDESMSNPVLALFKLK